MITLNFEEQGTSFPVNYNLLKVIAEHIPDDKRYEKLVDALLALDIPSINVEIASSFCNNLSKNDYDKLWNTGDIMVREAFIRDENSFCRRLTDERAHALMKEDNKEALICIGNNSWELFADNIEEHNISKSVARELLLFIKNHHDPAVRASLAVRSCTPDEFSMSFAEFLEAGLYAYAFRGLSNMTADDVENLKKINDLNLAIRVAENLEDAGKTKKIRKDLTKWLLDHPDPAVRITLAENPSTPVDVLRCLLEDPEPDVVQTARETLADHSNSCTSESLSFTQYLEIGLDEYVVRGLSTMTADDVENFIKINDLDLIINVANILENTGKTKKIRKDLTKWLLDHPDPAVRIALAKNSSTPVNVLRRLLEDPEPDVVQTARETLADKNK